jgi:hypothetical protein
MTGVQGFAYDIRTALLPFMFIFNTDLLLIDVTASHAVMVFIVALAAMLCFAAATQNYMLTRNRWWETIGLLLVAFTLFRPGFWLDRIADPFDIHEGPAILQAVENLGETEDVRLVIAGPDFDDGETLTKTVTITGGVPADGATRLDAAGLPVFVDAAALVLEEPFPGTPFFESLGNEYDFYADVPVTIARAEVTADRMPKEWFFIPALVLLGLIVLMQRARMGRNEEALA